MKRLTCVLTAALAVGVAFAKTTTWQGSSGGSWNADGNWDNGVPASGDTVILKDVDSVNDIAGLTLASLQFKGLSPVSISGESLTLAAGESSIVFGDAGSYAIALPLVLSAGDNTITVGSGTTATFSGVISGAGRPSFVGQNTYSDKVEQEWKQTLVWASVVKLTAHNTFTGGFKSKGTKITLSEMDSLGAEGTDVEYEGYGPLEFLNGGDIRYNFTGLGVNPWFVFRTLPVNLYGDISNDTSKAELSFIHYNATATITDSKCVNIYGQLYMPKGFIQGACGYVNVNLHKRTYANQLKGDAGCYGGANVYNFYAPSNQVTMLYNNSYGNFKCHVRDAFPKSQFTFTKYSNGTTLDMNGYDQTAMTIKYYATLDPTHNSAARIFTSATPATLTLKPTEDAYTFFSLRGAASLDWAPATARTLTLTNSVFKTTGRVKISNGKLVLEAGCTCDPSMAVDLATSASLDIAGGQSITVRALSIGGVPQWPGNYAFGKGELVVTSVEPIPFVWTGGGATTSAADADNWGGTAPDPAGKPHLPTFASGGSVATFDTAATYAGLSFDGDVADFTLSGSGVLTLNECGIAVGAGRMARQNATVVFTRTGQDIAVAEGATLRTGAALSSDVVVTKTDVGTWIVESTGSLAALSQLNLAAGELRFATGTDVAQTLPPMTVSGFSIVRVSDGVTLTVNTAPAVAAGVKLSIVTEGSGKLVTTALKGGWIEGVFLNGETLGFDAETGVGGAATYSGASIPARGGVIAPGGAVVTIDSDGDSAAGPITLGSAPATVGTLVQMTQADATVDLGSSTLTATSLVRTAGSGNLTFASGTVAAAENGITVENRDAEGEITVSGTLTSSQSVTKAGAGVFALSTAESWTLPFDLFAGTLAFTGDDAARLTVGKPESVTRATFTAQSASTAFTLTRDSQDVGTVEIAGSTPTGKTLKLIHRAGEMRLSGEGTVAANDFDIGASAGQTAKLTIDGGTRVTFGVTDGALRIGGAEAGANGGEVTIGEATVAATSYAFGHLSETDRSMLVGNAYGDGRLVLDDGAVVTNRVRLGEAGHVGALIVKNGASLRSIGGLPRSYSNPRYTAFSYSSSATVRGLGYTEVQKGGRIFLSGAATMSLLGTGLADAVLAVLGGNVDTASDFSAPFFFAPGAGLSTLYVSGGAFTNLLNYASKDTNYTTKFGCPMDTGTGQGQVTATDGGSCVFANAGGMLFRQNASKTNLGGTILNANDGGRIAWNAIATTTSDMSACLDDAGNAVYCPVYLNFNGGVFSPASQDKQTPFLVLSNRPVVSRITVFENGGTIARGGAGVNSHVMLTQAIDAPTGQGVFRIPWTSRAGFIGAPSVVIEGDGYGASAVALFDSASGAVTNIAVTSHGCDYTEATAVVRYASTEVARIACELADNVAGALTLCADRTYATAPRAWTVPEVVLKKYLCAQKDNILTNSLVTLTEGGQLSANDDWYTGNKNTIRLRAIRGTGGSIVSNGSTDKTVHVRELSLDGATGVNFNKMTLSVEGTWQLDARELAARAEAKTATGTYPCNIAFGADSAIAITHPEFLREDDRRYVLFSRAAGTSVTGSLKLAPGTVLPSGWNLRVTSDSVKLIHTQGLIMIIR